MGLHYRPCRAFLWRYVACDVERLNRAMLLSQARSKFNSVPLAWAIYDFGNSAYALLISAVAYQVYFKKIVFVGYQPVADLAWGVTVGLSILCSGLLAPLLGAIADSWGIRKTLLVVLTVVSITFTAGLSAVGPGDIFGGIFVFFLANLFYNLALVLYDSYLKLIPTRGAVASLSGFGWGIGYIGGLTCLAVTYPLFSNEPSVDNTAGFRLGFLAVSVFFLIFSFPAFRLLPNPTMRQVAPLRISSAFKEAYSTIGQTLRRWSHNKEAFKFMIAFYFVVDAIMTVIYFFANFLSTTFALQTTDILLMTVIIQLVGFPTTYLAGYLGDRWNISKALLVSIAIWTLIVLILGTGKTLYSLYLVCALIGLVIGSTQALGRALLATLIPEEKTGEFFGFNSFASKVAATFGPITFGAVSTWTGSQRVAWFSLLPFLVIGAFLLLRLRSTS